MSTAAPKARKRAGQRMGRSPKKVQAFLEKFTPAQTADNTTN